MSNRRKAQKRLNLPILHDRDDIAPEITYATRCNTASPASTRCALRKYSRSSRR